MKITFKDTSKIWVKVCCLHNRVLVESVSSFVDFGDLVALSFIDEDSSDFFSVDLGDMPVLQGVNFDDFLDLPLDFCRNKASIDTL